MNDYRPDIDGLRCIAVLAVVVHHIAPDALTGGYVGVDIFFVISGFLITKIIRTEIEEGRFTFMGFYERRARRIFPALFAVLVTTVVAAYFLLLPSDLQDTMRAAIGTLVFASNLVFWHDLGRGYFSLDASLNPLLHTWSLGVEEQFYVLFPAVLLLLYRFSRERMLPALFAMAVLSLAASEVLIQKDRSVWAFFLSPFRAWELAVGALLTYELPRLRPAWARSSMAAVGLAAIALACTAFTPTTPFPGVTALFPVLGAAAVIYVGSSGGSCVSRVLSFRPFVFIGLLSYSLYLWHWPLIVFAKYRMDLQPLGGWAVALFVASIALAWLSFRFIEEPFRKKNRFTRRTIFTASAVSSAAIASAAFAALLLAGMPRRFSEQVVLFDKARDPKIPFRSCNARSMEQSCRLGAGVTPTIMLWGDSHMLAWAPAFDRALKDEGKSAALGTVAACPPVLYLQNRAVAAICRQRTAELWTFLRSHPEIDKVVIAAFWGTYLRQDRASGADLVSDGSSITTALVDTIKHLQEARKQVVLLGPVPTYQQSVPLMLALEEAHGTRTTAANSTEQRRENEAFYRAMSSLRDVRFLDPVEWMCRPNCVTAAGGVALYRDAHHLSVEGSVRLAPRIRSALFGPEEKPSP